jgi:hypothetical protein
MTPGQANYAVNPRRVIPAWIVSVLVNSLVFGLFTLTIFLSSSRASVPAVVVETVDSTVESPTEDLTEATPGFNPALPASMGNERIEPVDVFSPSNPDQALGVPEAPPDGPVANVPPPPGFGGSGSVRGADGALPGAGGMSDLAGGAQGRLVAPGFRGRAGGNRENLALRDGGSLESERAVADGLLFLARHQAPDGHWSLDRFATHCNPLAPDPGPLLRDDGSTGPGIRNDVAGTAFGLLPFLGAGVTHKPAPPGTKRSVNYQKVVEAALRYLIAQQTREGEFPGGMYAHGLASIALCEAYGLTSDPSLKLLAQKALDFIVRAQNPTTGGWRYVPRSDGDTSVVGWQVMALKSGQMAGLSVPRNTLELAGKWLDSCMTSDKGGYGYTGPQETPTMTAVGLLCRMYLGWSPKNPGILAGVGRLNKVPPPPDPAALRNMYHYYYATQVMHHMGGDSWQAWNPKMRDWLIQTQDRGADPKHPWHQGSWDPTPDAHGKVGGRIMITSLSLLTLEVYYRHLPLYQRDLGVMKGAGS